MLGLTGSFLGGCLGSGDPIVVRQVRAACGQRQSLSLCDICMPIWLPRSSELLRNQSLTSRCISWMARFELRVSRSRNLRVRRAMVKWDSRGMVFLAAPEKFVVLDITVNMDVHPHPGPEEVDNDHGKRKQSSNSSDFACQPAIGSVRIHCSHNRDRLLSLRRSGG